MIKANFFLKKKITHNLLWNIIISFKVWKCLNKILKGILLKNTSFMIFLSFNIVILQYFWRKVFLYFIPVQTQIMAKREWIERVNAVKDVFYDSDVI